MSALALPLLLASACKGDSSAEVGDTTESETGDGDGDPGDGDGAPGDGDGAGDGDGDGDGAPGCTPGEITCSDGTAQICDDGMLSEEACDDECVDGLGCVACVPGSSTCEGDNASVCNNAGRWENSYCDPLQGQACNGDTGTCTGVCATIANGFLGCDFYPVVTAAAWQGGTFELGVMIANGNDQGTDVCITQGGSDNCMISSFVGPNTVQTFPLPDVPELKNGALSNMLQPSVLIEDASYRVRTTLPVSIYQFNPLGSFGSADASLLFPAHSWGTEYIVVSRNHWVYNNGALEFPGFYAVVGREQDTSVTLTPSATGGWVAPGGGVMADGTGTVTLHRGDVLEVFTWRDDMYDPMMAVPSDLTGTRVVATKPVQVIGGSKCTNIPFDVSACDRLEDAILPVSLASDSYIVSAPVQPNSNGMSSARRMVRIVATEDGTGLSYNPAIPGAPTTIEYAGDYVEFDSTASFSISASEKVLVAEYMTGAAFGGGGDPSMALAMPTESFLTEYLIVAPTSYSENWANIVFHKDTVIDLDAGTLIDAAGAEQIGVSDWRIRRVPLSNASDGTHLFVAQGNGMPFGLSIYGYAGAISYWYPGGLQLAQ